MVVHAMHVTIDNAHVNGFSIIKVFQGRTNLSSIMANFMCPETLFSLLKVHVLAAATIQKVVCSFHHRMDGNGLLVNGMLSENCIPGAFFRVLSGSESEHTSNGYSSDGIINGKYYSCFAYYLKRCLIPAKNAQFLA